MINESSLVGEDCSRQELKKGSADISIQGSGLKLPKIDECKESIIGGTSSSKNSILLSGSSRRNSGREQLSTCEVIRTLFMCLPCCK